MRETVVPSFRGFELGQGFGQPEDFEGHEDLSLCAILRSQPDANFAAACPRTYPFGEHGPEVINAMSALRKVGMPGHAVSPLAEPLHDLGSSPRINTLTV